MTMKVYWLYRWQPSEAQLRTALGCNWNCTPAMHLVKWRTQPYVFEESAYFAKRAAVRILQLERNPHEPIDPEHIQVKIIDLPMRWCMPHDQGSCVVLYAKSQAEAKSWIGGDAETLCRHYVEQVEKVEMGLPTCELCVQMLMKQYAKKALMLLPDATPPTVIRALLGLKRAPPRVMRKKKSRGK